MPIKFTPNLIPRWDATFLNYINQNFIRLQTALDRAAVETIGTSFPSDPYTGQEFTNTSVGVKYVYDGSTWRPVAHFGAPYSYTPVWTQNAVVAKTITEANYTTIGRTTEVWVTLTATSGGVANNIQTCTLPVNMAIASNKAVGEGYFLDLSLGVLTQVVVLLTGAAQVSFQTTDISAGVQLGQTGSGNGNAVAVGDILSFHMSGIGA